MSKKNKALKQLIKAQMQANAAATAQGKDLSSAPVVTMAPAKPNLPASPVSSAPIIADKQVSEFVLIKKDIRLSLILISAVIICIFLIFFIDRAHPFLLHLANLIFNKLT